MTCAALRKQISVKAMFDDGIHEFVRALQAGIERDKAENCLKVLFGSQ
jgi:hypothetical protein